jgi:NADPH:quinone reductase-like Zn-dependent oxidoreductase
MRDTVKLVCLEAGEPVRLALRRVAVPSPAAGEVVVRVEASSVNPIDVKRATGYGRRLLGLKGAGRFPLVLGNDLAGTVEAVGRGAGRWRVGDRVMGLLPTGKGGAHAGHVAVDASLLRPVVDAIAFDAQAVLPYTFTTLWLALRGAGITADKARGLSVVVHGASGGLGQLALQLLTRWGASVTAICSTSNLDLCRTLGAATVWDRTRQRLDDLPAGFDAGLNFGAWQDEETLVGRLRKGALGHATAVHPLLSNFDRHGWLAGAWRSRGDWNRMRTLAEAKGARYRWTVFQPDQEALTVLHDLVVHGTLALPIGIAVPLSDAQSAFDHVARRKRGRAVLHPLP